MTKDHKPLWDKRAWHQEDYAQLKEVLLALAEEEYQAFSRRLIATAFPILGVRMPRLKALAKEISRGDFRRYLAAAPGDSHEEILLQAFVIGFCPCPLEEKLALAAAFVPKMDNWGVCDSFCSSLKAVGKNKAQGWDFLQPYLQAPEEMQRRFALVLLLMYYIEEDYLPRLFEAYQQAETKGYYVQMAIAWGLSQCFVKFPAETRAYLENCTLDDFTYRKTLQKIRESFKVDAATKAEIKKLKRKNTGGSHGS